MLKYLYYFDIGILNYLQKHIILIFITLQKHIKKTTNNLKSKLYNQKITVTKMLINKNKHYIYILLTI
ncbi:hypothetical protein HNQ02_000319 [Flavobacterium sp. 7E]|nr:hypothetical protein [Flavobacterium sp. 7E]